MVTLSICKLAFFKAIVDALSNGFKVQKLFVGVSSTESLLTPVATEKFTGVTLFPNPDESVPSAEAELLSSNFRW